MEHPSLEYVAGFFDGEGSIGIYGRKRLAMRVCVTQVSTSLSTPLMNGLATRFGGAISRVGRMKKTHRRAVMWSVYGRAAAQALRQLRPYLILKAPQADVAMAYQDRQLGIQRDLGGRIMHRPPTADDLRDRKQLHILKKRIRPLKG